MYRIENLVAIILGISSICNVARAQEELNISTFLHYKIELRHTLMVSTTDPEYWKLRYQKTENLENALVIDVSQLFYLYLSKEQIDFKEVEAEVAQDHFIIDNFALASSTAIRETTLRMIKNRMPKLKLLESIELSKIGNSLIPQHFRVIDDEAENELPAYYDRGIQKVKMSLNRTDPGNWFTWFIHEHLHFFDSILTKAEKSFDDQNTLESVASWVRESGGRVSVADRKLLNRYFSDLTDLSLKAEWRAWIATTIFAQKAFGSGLLKEVPPCLTFLQDYGFPDRILTLNELRQIWWEKLKPGFKIENRELWTDPHLREELIQYVNQLNPIVLPVGHLIELVN